MLHQRERHTRCQECFKKLNTSKALAVHCLNVHKRALTAVPNALPGREDPAWDIFGMAGVPEGMKPGDDPPTRPPSKKEAAAAAAAAEVAAAAAAAAGMRPGMPGMPGMQPGFLPPGMPPPGIRPPGMLPPGVPPLGERHARGLATRGGTGLPLQRRAALMLAQTRLRLQCQAQNYIDFRRASQLVLVATPPVEHPHPYRLLPAQAFARPP